jgi:hypothetical protein
MMNVELPSTFGVPCSLFVILFLSIVFYSQNYHGDIYEERKTVCRNDRKIIFFEAINDPQYKS